MLRSGSVQQTQGLMRAIASSLSPSCVPGLFQPLGHTFYSFLLVADSPVLRCFLLILLSLVKREEPRAKASPAFSAEEPSQTLSRRSHPQETFRGGGSTLLHKEPTAIRVTVWRNGIPYMRLMCLFGPHFEFQKPSSLRSGPIQWCHASGFDADSAHVSWHNTRQNSHFRSTASILISTYFFCFSIARIFKYDNWLNSP